MSCSTGIWLCGSHNQGSNYALDTEPEISFCDLTNDMNKDTQRTRHINPVPGQRRRRWTSSGPSPGDASGLPVISCFGEVAKKGITTKYIATRIHVMCLKKMSVAISHHEHDEVSSNISNVKQKPHLSHLLTIFLYNYETLII